jgi:hypothetical protein
MRCRGSLEIASRNGEPFCTVTLYWHEYGGYTVVRENDDLMSQVFSGFDCKL